MTGIIILAAGSSSRLGQPKQNLQYKGKTLLQHAVDEALDSGCSPVIVVLGANADKIKFGTDGVTVLHNPDWQEGMASSIRLGVTEIMKHTVDSVIVMLCDQPFVDGNLLKTLKLQWQEVGKPIVACSYKGTVGVPVLFDSSLFPELLKLQGQEGAKKVLSAYADEIAEVEFEEGSTDIDTAENYHDLISRLNVN
ncbi:nucleotidyltransferase family protein [Mucilaginibacter pedocola]|uniref:MobA-like protein n=1 Tax=Mucilaginibacter pedocola TaxID=1792845 RepID=A0A1S9P630_9SPHI|nr:nucleotidyltransferase family protein [Mucilaginibacter pedocola]OOQ56412.1 MobA-like protein [Mucilaginibacter pedocola]